MFEVAYVIASSHLQIDFDKDQVEHSDIWSAFWQESNTKQGFGYIPVVSYLCGMMILELAWARIKMSTMP